MAPSAVRIQNGQAFTYEGPKDFSTPRELSKAEIKELINDFAVSAKNAIEAGGQPSQACLAQSGARARCVCNCSCGDWPGYESKRPVFVL